MPDIRDAIHEMFGRIGLRPHQIVMIIGFIIIVVSISVSVGYWWGLQQIDNASLLATYTYCTDVNRAGCEQQCCNFEELVRERCPYLGKFQ